MITNVYYVRHAQPDFSVKDDLIRPLTQKGMEDSKRVTSALINKEIATVYSSPYKRAFDTVKNLADALHLEIITDSNFCERRVGTWIDDFKDYSRKQWEDFNFKLANGESLKEVQERNISVLNDTLKGNMGKNIVIGTHGTALSTIINYFKPDFGYDDFWKIIDRMPYILRFRFNDMEFESIKEIEI